MARRPLASKARHASWATFVLAVAAWPFGCGRSSGSELPTCPGGVCEETPACTGEGCDSVAPSGPCAGLPCGAHGTCRAVGTDGRACDCDLGWGGETCDVCAEGWDWQLDACVPVPACEDVDCGDHGDCTVLSSGEPSCACRDGYSGAACDTCAAGRYVVGNSCVDRVLFALPIDVAVLDIPVIGFDHDPTPGWSGLACQSYMGQAFPACYDGHDGSDYELSGGFAAMDAGSTPVLAAAEGEVIFVHDGEFDRCLANPLTLGVECPGQNGITPANRVELRHVDGTVSKYLHFKKLSILVEVGEWVRCGQPLGLVGSSGYSSAPHLHFEVENADGVSVDPYAGPYSQPESYWLTQTTDTGYPGSACQGS